MAVCEILLSPLTPKALAIAGAFYFFIRSNNSPYRHSIPGTNQYSAPPRAGFLLNKCYDGSIGAYPMSEEQLKAFLEKVKEDTSIQEKLKLADNAEAVAAIAKEAGFNVSADLITKAQSEITEEDLGVVRGTGKIHRLTETEFKAAGWWSTLP